MRRRCSLCGGKLRGNVCTECGLDNSKNDSNYITGKSHGDKVSLTHVHTEREDPFSGKTMTREQQEQVKAAIRRRRQPSGKAAGGNGYRAAGEAAGENGYRVAGEAAGGSGYLTAGKAAGRNGYRAASAYRPRKKSKIVIGVIVGLIIVLIISMPDLIGAFSDVFGDGDAFYDWGAESGYDYDSAEASAEEDPYMFASRELSEEGEEYEITLGPGSYKGGVHIPEGNYTVEYVEGKGYLALDDWENSIYLYGPLGFEDTDDFEPMDDFRVYEGGVVKIDGTLRLIFRSENAQTDLEYMENPNTEIGEFSENFVVGKDIPAGAYDVTVLEGKGSVEFEILLDEATEYYTYEGVDFMVDGAREYKNFVLPDGTHVTLYGTIKIRLTPSERIESEDYEKFYPVF